jgi:hypothetical protein
MSTVFYEDESHTYPLFFEALQFKQPIEVVVFGQVSGKQPEKHPVVGRWRDDDQPAP